MHCNFLCADDDIVEPSSPELIVPSPPPQQAATEPEPMEVDTAPATTAEPQYMQRKLVSKTYVNEEGYMGKLLKMPSIEVGLTKLA